MAEHFRPPAAQTEEGLTDLNDLLHSVMSRHGPGESIVTADQDFIEQSRIAPKPRPMPSCLGKAACTCRTDCNDEFIAEGHSELTHQNRMLG